MKDCIFCQIINKEKPSKTVLETEKIMAFWDIAPQAPFHILIVPKKHIASLKEAGEEDKEILGEILLGAKKVAEKLGFSESGFRIIVNTGKDAGMVVEHLHFHVLGGKFLGSKLVK